MTKKNAPRDWSRAIERLNESKTGRASYEMGSPGSAQVTRCRLLEQWNGLTARTEGSRVILSLG